MRRVAGRIVPQVALLVGPARPPAGEQDRHRAAGDGSARRLERLDLLDGRRVVRIGGARSTHVDDDRRGDQGARRDPVGRQAAFGEMRGGVEVRAAVLAGAEAVRGVEVPRLGHAAEVVGQLERPGRRPVDRLVVEGIRHVDDPLGSEVEEKARRGGAGKTTLIRMLIDIIAPDDGRILLDGRPLAPADRDRIGYLPEERGLYRKEKVIDILIYFGMLKGLARREALARSRAWLERLGLPEVAGRRADFLSKGMQQKVQIAGTLLHSPAILVMDEPFSGLDPLNTVLVKDLDRKSTRLNSSH